jgi:hypothetical protein
MVSLWLLLIYSDGKTVGTYAEEVRGSFLAQLPTPNKRLQRIGISKAVVFLIQKLKRFAKPLDDKSNIEVNFG